MSITTGRADNSIDGNGHLFSDLIYKCNHTSFIGTMIIARLIGTTVGAVSVRANKGVEQQLIRNINF
jgi:hypothetical protein